MLFCREELSNDASVGCFFIGSFSPLPQIHTSWTTRTCRMWLSWWRGNPFMHIKFCCLQLHPGKEDLCCFYVFISFFYLHSYNNKCFLLLLSGSSRCCRTDQQQRTPASRSATSSTIFSMWESLLSSVAQITVIILWLHFKI